jgi:aryl-alcohol dehydrogenase-like predicted oxidoreductase
VRIAPFMIGRGYLLISFLPGLGTNWSKLMGECTKENAFDLLETFYNLGGNFIDTANQYQGGQSEEWIGEWVEKTGRRSELVISTKYTLGWKTGQPVQHSNFGGTGTKSMRVSIEASLQKLRTSYVDLV